MEGADHRPFVFGPFSWALPKGKVNFHLHDRGVKTWSRKLGSGPPPETGR